MTKFKVGDRVKCVSNLSEGRNNPRYNVGSTGTVVLVITETCFDVNWDHNSDIVAAYASELVFHEVEPEHPALTQAKREFLRLKALPVQNDAVYGATTAYLAILHAFGMTYREKPPVPQPKEYEIVSIR